MNDVDVILGYPWIKSVGIVIVNMKKKFLKIWYKRNKITLQDMFLSKPEGLVIARFVIVQNPSHVLKYCIT
jgi:hypothetical protein